MKRRNVDCGKLRRPLKRSKLTEGLYGSTFLYIKFLSFWALVLLADFLLEFRFEFLWPFWLLLRSVYDSFKYQGFAFSVFFVCVALTSDMICFLFIPIHWLFFAASTYVWVQYVWHTDRGVCLPTVCLWLLFIYIEASVRLKDLKHLPAHLDLCRPFAAHCIGYPVVTLGFGIKSYVGYRIRQRRQREVAKENEFYTQLLLEALPPEQQQLYLQQQQQLPTSPEKTRGWSKEEENSTSSPNANVSLTWNSSSSTPNSISSSASSTAPSPTALVMAPRPASPVPVQGPAKLPAPSWSSKKASAGDKEKELRTSSEKAEKADKVAKLSNGAVKDIDFYDHKGSVNDYHEGSESDKTYKQQLNGPSNHTPVRASVVVKETPVVANGKEKKAKLNNQQSNVNSANNNNVKDEHCLRLECDIKRLKADLQSSRAAEQDLRAQVQQLNANERSVRSELSQSLQDNDNLQAKLHNLVSARQTDKQTMASLEKKLSEERKARANAEALLAAERRTKKTEVTPPQPVAPPRNECGEACKNRKRELEAEVKQLRREVKLSEERARQVEQEAQSLRALQASTARSAANQANVASAETEMFLTALSNLQDKNAHLQTSLNAETRLKLDLFSALGEARSQLELRETILLAREREIVELKSKVAEVLAVMPTTPSHIQNNGALDLRLDVGLRLSDLADLADFGLNAMPQLTDLDITGRPYTSKLLLPTSLGLTHAHLANSARNGNVMTPDHDLKGSNLDPNATAYTPKTLGNGDSN